MSYPKTASETVRELEAENTRLRSEIKNHIGRPRPMTPAEREADGDRSLNFARHELEQVKS